MASHFEILKIYLNCYKDDFFFILLMNDLYQIEYKYR